MGQLPRGFLLLNLATGVFFLIKKGYAYIKLELNNELNQNLNRL